MLKRRLTYFFSLAAMILLLEGCIDSQSKMPSMVETYAKKDTKPFGASVAYRQLAAMYSVNNIQDKKNDFKDTWENISDTGALYVCLAPKLFLTSEEVSAMMEYVEAGNSLFISAASIDDLLLDEIGCKQIYNAPEMDAMLSKMGNTSVNTTAQPGLQYEYFYYPFQNYFTNIDSSTTRVLGFNGYKQPNLLVYFKGKGKLYLQCEPRAYSNYFLLKADNYQYLKSTVAYTENIPQHVYWDDYYYKLRSRKNSDNDFSSLTEIMKNPPLKAAFILSLILLALYILFGGKRLQRIIQPLKSNENTTVTFTETIGRLYLQKKDNKNITDKMITYFNEYIRNTYFLNSTQANNDFIVMLSRKSGVDKDKVDILYRTISATQSSDVVNDYQLLSLQQQIQHFYKSSGTHI